MGMNMSFMGEKGLSMSQMWSLIISTLYKQFEEKDIKDFDAFNVVFLDIFNTINMALPGKHYDAPSHKDVMGLFKQLKEAKDEAKKEIFTDFMNKNVNINKVDKSMIATAIVAPPAAMVAKRTGQSLPQLKLMKSIPDVVFVPSATILSLITIKLLGTIFMGNKASKDAKDHDELQHSNSNNILSQQPEPSTEPSSSQQPEPSSSQQPEPSSSQQPEPSPSQQPETSTAQPPQQPESAPTPAEPAPTPAEPTPTPAEPAPSQQSVPTAAAISLEPAAAAIPLALAPAASQQSEPAAAHSHEHSDKENPDFCVYCNIVH